MTAAIPGRTATRIDPVSKVREDATFIKAGGDEIFCLIDHPPSTPRRAVVICPTILAEEGSLCRAEVRVARAFATQGWPAIRFDYRGTGFSGGALEATTLDTMADDARRAAEFLADATGVESVVFCGARWGGHVASAASGSYPGAPLALWSPVLDCRRYLSDVITAQNMRALNLQVKAKMTMAQVEHDMKTAGYADLMAYPLYRGLYETMLGRGLREVAAGDPRPVLLVQISQRQGWRADIVALKDAFTTGGSRVESALLTSEDPIGWSMHFGAQCADALISVTSRWLTELEATP